LITKRPCRAAWSFLNQAYELFLYVTNVLFFGRIKEKVADGSNEAVDTESDVTENEVSPASGGVTFGLEAGVVDDDATDPTKEESEQETNYFVGINGVCIVGVVVHVMNLLLKNFLYIVSLFFDKVNSFLKKCMKK
jgi:hypothetical protein